MTKISEFRILTIQDLCTLLEVSETKAKQVKKDIQNEYKIKFVMFTHFKKYFSV